MNLGIIGFGYTGQQHARALKAIPHASVRAVADSDPARLSEAEVPAYGDYHKLLDDPTLEAVSICLPHHLHEQVGTESILAGKHVLMEKPLAISVAAGERLCQLARRESRILMVEMTHRFMPSVIEARELVQAGEVGEVIAVTETLVSGVGVPYSFPAWMFSKSLAGGGVGLTNGIHLLDHTAWITGQSLSLDSARFCYSHALGDIDDVAAFSLHLSAGAPVQILMGWRADASELQGEVSIFGSRGTLTIHVWKGWRLTNAKGSRNKVCFDEQSTFAQRACVGMENALTEFVAAVREGRDPHPRAEETLTSQRLIEQAYVQSEGNSLQDGKAEAVAT